MGTPSDKDEAVYGIDSALGGRAKQQDSAMALLNMFTVNSKVYNVFGIFDGHGTEGHNAAHAAKASFQKTILERKDDLDANPSEVLKQIFAVVQEELINDESWDSYLSGTTAVIVIVVNGKIHSAHVGDSKVVLVSKTNGVLKGKSLTMYILFNSDHTCQNQSELKRLHSKGARIEQLVTDGKADGPLRIFKGSLPYPGRALGDTSAKACGVTYEPDVSTTNIESDDFYLILGTDGVWDGISIDEAVNCLDLKLSPKELSKRILDAGLKGLSKNQIDDNITNVVVNLKAL